VDLRGLRDQPAEAGRTSSASKQADVAVDTDDAACGGCRKRRLIEATVDVDERWLTTTQLLTTTTRLLTDQDAVEDEAAFRAKLRVSGG